MRLLSLLIQLSNPILRLPSGINSSHQLDRACSLSQRTRLNQWRQLSTSSSAQSQTHHRARQVTTKITTTGDRIRLPMQTCFTHRVPPSFGSHEYPPRSIPVRN